MQGVWCRFQAEGPPLQTETNQENCQEVNPRRPQERESIATSWGHHLARAAACGVLLLICLGGLRMLFDARLPAKWFDCTAPLVFGLCTATAVLTSPAWRRRPSLPAARRDRQQTASTGRGLRWVAAGVTVGIYLLVVFGAQLRYPPWNAAPDWFVLWVWLKLIAAGSVAFGVALLSICVRRTKLLALLFVVELLLGAGVWVTNYNWPAWFRYHVWSIDYTPDLLGPLHLWTTVANVAVGSLSLGVSLSVTLWAWGD